MTILHNFSNIHVKKKNYYLDVLIVMIQWLIGQLSQCARKNTFPKQHCDLLYKHCCTILALMKQISKLMSNARLQIIQIWMVHCQAPEHCWSLCRTITLSCFMKQTGACIPQMCLFFSIRIPNSVEALPSHQVNVDQRTQLGPSSLQKPRKLNTPLMHIFYITITNIYHSRSKELFFTINFIELEFLTEYPLLYIYAFVGLIVRWK